MIESAHSHEITHLGEPVRCYRWAPSTAGGKAAAPKGRMLLSHGWEGYAFNFAMLIEQAVSAGWEVHAFDHLGHAASGGRMSGLPIVLSTLIAVGQEIGPVDVLIGHSLGGGAAAWAAAHGKVSCERAVLLAPFFDTRYLSGMWCKAHLLPDSSRDLLQSALESDTGLTFDDFMPRTLAPFMRKPALIVHDPSDRLTTIKHSRTFSELATHTQLREAPGLGHIGLLADTAVTAEIMAFAQQTPAAIKKRNAI